MLFIVAICRFVSRTRQSTIGGLRFPDCTPEIDGKISGKLNESWLITRTWFVPGRNVHRAMYTGYTLRSISRRTIKLKTDIFVIIVLIFLYLFPSPSMDYFSRISFRKQANSRIVLKYKKKYICVFLINCTILY